MALVGPTRYTRRMQASGPVVYQNDEFSITLDSRWRAREDADPKQRTFEDESRRARLVISCALYDLTRDHLIGMAHTVATARAKGHGEHTPIPLDYDIVEMAPDGAMAHIAQAGRSPGGFHWLEGWVTERKLLNFFVEVDTENAVAARQVFDEAFRGFQLYVP